MLQQAIAKIEKEMAEKKEPYISAIGDYLKGHLNGCPEDSAAILTEGKTIDGSITFMKEKARKKAKGGFAMFTPDEGFAIVMEYYGMKGTNGAKGVADHSESSKKLDLDLDQLL